MQSIEPQMCDCTSGNLEIPGSRFGMRNEIDQNAVKQVDVIRCESCRALQEQFGDPSGCLGAAPGIAVPGRFHRARGSAIWQLTSNSLKPQQTPSHLRVFRQFRWAW
jgi:hypothetical protein